jgi:hypothetical protein
MFKKGERFLNGIPLCHVVAADKPNRIVMDPGGVMLCHQEELRRWADPQSLDQIPTDQTTEINVENTPSHPG